MRAGRGSSQATTLESVSCQTHTDMPDACTQAAPVPTWTGTAPPPSCCCRRARQRRHAWQGAAPLPACCYSREPPTARQAGPHTAAAAVRAPMPESPRLPFRRAPLAHPFHSPANKREVPRRNPGGNWRFKGSKDRSFGRGMHALAAGPPTTAATSQRSKHPHRLRRRLHLDASCRGDGPLQGRRQVSLLGSGTGRRGGRGLLRHARQGGHRGLPKLPSGGAQLRVRRGLQGVRLHQHVPAATKTHVQGGED